MFAALMLAALPQVAAPEKDWTLLIYGAADNSSEASFVPDMHFLMQGLSSPGVEVLAFVDRSAGYSDDAIGLGEDFTGARLYRLTHAGPERLSGGEEFPEISGRYEANSGDVATLRKALRWAKASSPAKRYGLVFYSHGNGRSWCPDEGSSGDELFPAELTDGLEQRDSVDLLVFDVCQMGGVELAYQWRPREGAFGADVMVATPMAGFPFPWREILQGVAASDVPTAELDAAGFARIIVEVSRADRERGQAQASLPEHIAELIAGEAMASYDLGRCADVKRAVDELARGLARMPDAKPAIEALRGRGEDIHSLHYLGPQLDQGWRNAPHFDLHDLARRIEALPEATEEVRAAAARVRESVDAMVLDSYGMRGYDAQGGFQSGRHGLYILFPDGDAPESTAPEGTAPEGTAPTPRQWRRFAWYHPGDLRESEHAYGRYAWCADGAASRPGEVGNWYQLLAHWYGED